jgi:tetraacyldisaccharide 4'-kinase
MNLKTSIVRFFENLYYRPRWYHWIVALALLPFSLLYAFIMMIRRRIAKRRDLGIPIVSVGNLLVGGSGKTPMTIALAGRFDRPAVVLRGYGRKSEGLVVVSEWGDIRTEVETAGDEAMLLARALPHATVIVCEVRVSGFETVK